MTPDETEHFTLLRAERDRYRAEAQDLLEKNKALKSQLAAMTRQATTAEERADSEHEAAEKMRSALWSLQVSVDEVIKELGTERRRQ